MNKMANDPYGEADRSTGGRLEMVNGLMFDFTPPHYGNVVKYGDG